MNRESTSSNIAKVFPVSVAFHVRPPNAQSFPALFRGLPWFNISGKDLFCSAHVDEVRVHSVDNSGFTIARTVTNHFLYLDLGCAPSEVSSSSLVGAELPQWCGSSWIDDTYHYACPYVCEDVDNTLLNAAVSMCS